MSSRHPCGSNEASCQSNDLTLYRNENDSWYLVSLSQGIHTKSRRKVMKRPYLTLPNILIISVVGMMMQYDSYCTAFVAPIARRSSPNDSTTTMAPTCQQVSSSSSSSLHMVGGGSTSIIDRLSRVVKSNVNKWVSNVENPEKVINQSVNDLQVIHSLWDYEYWTCTCRNVCTWTHL